jgi:hypothetical protein
MLAIIALFIPIIFVGFIFELVSRSVYGNIISDELINKALDQNMPLGIHVNSIDKDIITIGKMPFIAHGGRTFLTTYYVDGVGRINKFSKGHKRIKEIYKNLYNSEKTIKEKLNIN